MSTPFLFTFIRLRPVHMLYTSAFELMFSRSWHNSCYEASYILTSIPPSAVDAIPATAIVDDFAIPSCSGVMFTTTPSCSYSGTHYIQSSTKHHSKMRKTAINGSHIVGKQSCFIEEKEDKEAKKKCLSYKKNSARKGKSRKKLSSKKRKNWKRLPRRRKDRARKNLQGSRNRKNCDSAKARWRKDPPTMRVRWYAPNQIITLSLTRTNASSLANLAKLKIGISVVVVGCGCTPTALVGYIQKSRMFVMYALKFFRAPYL